MWNTIFVQPLLNLLLVFYKVLFSNLGLAILGMTILIRLLLFPLTLPMLKMARKQRLIQPELDKLKEKYGEDKEKLAREQMSLLRENGINPALGCLPNLVQFVFLIALYQVFIKVLGTNGQDIDVLNQLSYWDYLRIPAGSVINIRFLHLDLTQPDPYHILPVLAGVLQWGAARLGRAQRAPVEKDGKSDIMGDIQGQMGILFPLMTVFVGFRLQSGLVLYWVASVLLSLLQQWWVARGYAGESTQHRAKND